MKLVSHMHKAKLVKGEFGGGGRQVELTDLNVGLIIYYPSGMGGVYRYQCKKLNDKMAEFRVLNKDVGEWSKTLTFEFDQVPLTAEELNKLRDILKASRWWLDNLREVIDLMSKAERLGYIYRSSTTQSGWLEFGLSELKKLDA